MKKIGSLILSSIFFTALPAFADVHFDATVDRNQLSADDSLNLILTVSGDSDLGDASPTLPEMKGFEVMGSRQQSSTSSIYSNGKFQMLRSMKYIYTLMPQKVGTLTIGSAEIDVKGKKLQTKPITIKVLPPGSEPKNSGRGRQQQDDDDAFPMNPFGDDEDSQFFNQLLKNRGITIDPRGGIRAAPSKPDRNAFFVTVEANKRKVYVGEQIVATWYFYTKGNVQSFDPLKYPDLKGFRKEDLEVAQRLNFQQEIINGQAYNKALLVSYALFPISPGKKTIDPLKIKASVIDLSGGMGVFGIGRPYTYTKASEELPIEVLPLPTEGRPASFSGAVGKFTITGSLSSTTAKVNQPVSLKIKFQGKGNVNAIELPALNFPSNLEVYDTKKESQFNKTGEGYIEFEVLLIPRTAGDVTVPPIELSFFDPQSAKYTTQKTPEFKLKVLPGEAGAVSNAFSSPMADSSAPSVAVKEYRMLKSEPQWALNKTLGKILWLLMFLLPTAWLFAQIIRLKKAGNSDLRGALSKKVNQRLKTAKVKLAAGDHRSAGVELNNAILSVLGEVSGVGGASQTADQLLMLIGCDEKLREETLSFLSQCELMSYAPEEMASLNRDQKILRQAEKLMAVYLNMVGKKPEIQKAAEL